MTYATTNPPAQIKSLIGSGPSLWIYKSTDVHTDVDADGYFTNGFDLGMKVDDVVMVVKTTATVGATLHSVLTVVTNGAATISPAILA